MKVLLTDNLRSVGKIGDIVTVTAGYARNYLFPKGLAVATNPRNLAQREHHLMLVEHKRKKDVKNAQTLVAAIEQLSLTIPKKAGENEKLFGSVTNIDIEKALQAEGVDIERSSIQLEEPIKKLGVYHIPVKIVADVSAKLKVWVVEQ